jgi:propanol-preferring alcohol dehydrogenase
MKAMLFEQPGQPLTLSELPIPTPGEGQVLVQVEACGVCRTDLHVRAGELARPKLPLVLGHEIIGRVAALGSGVDRFQPGQRVGVPWLGWTCGQCRYCLSGQENLCELARFTGYTLDGGYAEYTLADQRYCFPVDPLGDAAHLAPLMCAGLIGYRAYRMAGEPAQKLGFYGFGAAAHIIAQVATSQGRQVFAFTSPGDSAAQEFARSLGAVWAGASTQMPPEPLDAAILFAPVGALVPLALQAVVPGGTVVCAGIHMSDIPTFPYSLLWGERVVRSVANLTRRDGEELLALTRANPVHTRVERFRLEQADQALDRLQAGKIQGAAVLVTDFGADAGG